MHEDPDSIWCEDSEIGELGIVVEAVQALVRGGAALAEAKYLRSAGHRIAWRTIATRDTGRTGQYWGRDSVSIGRESAMCQQWDSKAPSSSDSQCQDSTRQEHGTQIADKGPRPCNRISCGGLRRAFLVDFSCSPAMFILAVETEVAAQLVLEISVPPGTRKQTGAAELWRQMPIRSLNQYC